MTKFSRRLSKGFTIVELLVVIAIIAVLAAIVLVNVTQYIAKAKISAQVGNLATILTNSAVFYDANTSYSGFHSNSTFTNPATAITNAASTVSYVSYAESSTGFCACAKLAASTTVAGTAYSYYCVDSTGNKKYTNTACDASESTKFTAGTIANHGNTSGDECSDTQTTSSNDDLCL